MKRKNHKTPSHEHRVAFRILMKSFSTHLTSQTNTVSTRMLRFSRAISSHYIDGIWFRHFAEMRLRALQLSILTNVYLSTIMPSLSQIIKSLYSSPVANALPVADAVSFEFDGIDVTAQHVMAQTAPLYDHFIKDYRGSKFRRTDVFMRG